MQKLKAEAVGYYLGVAGMFAVFVGVAGLLSVLVGAPADAVALADAVVQNDTTRTAFVLHAQ